MREALDSIQAGGAEVSFEAATTVGLALQACYLSEVTDKLHVWKDVATLLALKGRPWLESSGSVGKYPLTAFAWHYLSGRDAVALSNIIDSLDGLKSWIGDPNEKRDEATEGKLFWLIVGLVECGKLSLALDMIMAYKPTTAIYLMAIHMGCFLADHVRQLPSGQKKAAKEICGRLEKAVHPLRAQLINEFGSQLLEIRKGKIESVDEEREGASE